MKNIKTFEGFFKKSKSDTEWNYIESDELEKLGFQLQSDYESVYYYIPKYGEVRKIEIDKIGNELYNIYLKMESSDDDNIIKISSLSELIEFINRKIPIAEKVQRKNL